MSKYINEKFIIIAILIAALIVGVFAFYKYGRSGGSGVTQTESDNSFIEGIADSPVVEGNIVNSGIAGRVVLPDGKNYSRVELVHGICFTPRLFTINKTTAVLFVASLLNSVGDIVKL